MNAEQFSKWAQDSVRVLKIRERNVEYKSELCKDDIEAVVKLLLDLGLNSSSPVSEATHKLGEHKRDSFHHEMCSKMWLRLLDDYRALVFERAASHFKTQKEHGYYDVEKAFFAELELGSMCSNPVYAEHVAQVRLPTHQLCVHLSHCLKYPSSLSAVSTNTANGELELPTSHRFGAISEEVSQWLRASHKYADKAAFNSEWFHTALSTEVRPVQQLIANLKPTPFPDTWLVVKLDTDSEVGDKMFKWLDTLVMVVESNDKAFITKRIEADLLVMEADYKLTQTQSQTDRLIATITDSNEQFIRQFVTSDIVKQLTRVVELMEQFAGYPTVAALLTKLKEQISIADCSDSTNPEVAKQTISQAMQQAADKDWTRLKISVLLQLQQCVKATASGILSRYNVQWRIECLNTLQHHVESWTSDQPPPLTMVQEFRALLQRCQVQATATKDVAERTRTMLFDQTLAKLKSFKSELLTKLDRIQTDALSIKPKPLEYKDWPNFSLPKAWLARLPGELQTCSTFHQLLANLSTCHDSGTCDTPIQVEA